MIPMKDVKKNASVIYSCLEDNANINSMKKMSVV